MNGLKSWLADPAFEALSLRHKVWNAIYLVCHADESEPQCTECADEWIARIFGSDP